MYNLENSKCYLHLVYFVNRNDMDSRFGVASDEQLRFREIENSAGDPLTIPRVSLKFSIILYSYNNGIVYLFLNMATSE